MSQSWTLLPQTAEYALRVIVWLAEHPERQQPAREIARGTRIPQRYLFRVLGRLTAHGLLERVRGRGGGFRLARDPAEITMLDVVEAVAPLRRIDRCPLGIEEHAELCALHAALDNAYAALIGNLQSVTIARLLRQKQRPTPLCTKEPPARLHAPGSPASQRRTARQRRE